MNDFPAAPAPVPLTDAEQKASEERRAAARVKRHDLWTQEALLGKACLAAQTLAQTTAVEIPEALRAEIKALEDRILEVWQDVRERAYDAGYDPSVEVTLAARGLKEGFMEGYVSP